MKQIKQMNLITIKKKKFEFLSTMVSQDGFFFSKEKKTETN